jgi:hypothetical protein
MAANGMGWPQCPEAGGQSSLERQTVQPWIAKVAARIQ